jgi:hypothetical protein
VPLPLAGIKPVDNGLNKVRAAHSEPLRRSHALVF